MRSIGRFWDLWRRRRRSGSPRPRLLVAQSVTAYIAQTAAASPAVETGGILMGPTSASSSMVAVTYASGPGPRARHERGMFLRDTEYCRKVLQEHYDQFEVDYVGEWHSHVEPLHRPSGGDIPTIAGIMNDPDYDFTAFAMIIAIVGMRKVDSDATVRLLGFVATRSELVQVPIEVIDAFSDSSPTG